MKDSVSCNGDTFLLSAAPFLSWLVGTQTGSFCQLP